LYKTGTFAPQITEVMRLTFFLILLFSMVKSIELNAQAVNQTEGTRVVFDPLFWKDDLKLSESQYHAISNINKEYYQAIYQVVNENEGKIDVLRQATAELLQKRSDLIWNTFQPKQKKIWKKLSSTYTNGNPTAANSPLSKDRHRFPG
jgi:hypothetical protein